MDSSERDGPIVHIVDDDEAPRRAIEKLCRSIGLSACTYSSAQEFLNAKRDGLAGCLVLDVRLKGSSGLEFQAHLPAHGIHLPVILISGHADVPMSVRAMKAGAVDFLAKPFRDQDLLDAITVAIERDRQRRAVENGSVALRERFLSLSSREQQVMMLVTEGKMNKQVAGELGVSEATVKLHRGAVMHKMAAQSLSDLVRMADIVRAWLP